MRIIHSVPLGVTLSDQLMTPCRCDMLNLLVDLRPQEKPGLPLPPLSSASQPGGDLEVQEDHGPVQQPAGCGHQLKPPSMRGNGHHPVKPFLLQQEVEISVHLQVSDSSQQLVHRVQKVMTYMLSH